MIYLQLLLGFLRVGLFSFGGAYGAIPLIRDVVLSYGWMSDELLTYMIAVSESTPGPIMVNLATFIGNNQAGLIGAILATVAVVLPSFVIILLVMIAFSKVLKHKTAKAILAGIKPAMIGIILSSGIYMLFNQTFYTLNGKAMGIAAILVALKVYFKNKMTPIMLIVVSACLGIVFYGI